MTLKEKYDMTLSTVENLISRIEDIEFKATLAREKLSVVEAENLKLRAEFESLRNRWLAIDRALARSSNA